MKAVSVLGNKWKKHRKIITPTFHFKILEQFTDIYYSAGKVLIKKLNSVGNKESIDIFSYINLYALDVICGKYRFEVRNGMF